MREAMPLVAAFIDDLRAAFGADAVNAHIRRGMAGEPGFWASENGHILGTKMPECGNAITADRMSIGPVDTKTCGCPACVAGRRSRR